VRGMSNDVWSGCLRTNGMYYLVQTYDFFKFYQTKQVRNDLIYQPEKPGKPDRISTSWTIKNISSRMRQFY
jgi:hypothetical protein